MTFAVVTQQLNGGRAGDAIPGGQPRRNGKQRDAHYFGLGERNSRSFSRRVLLRTSHC